MKKSVFSLAAAFALVLTACTGNKAVETPTDSTDSVVTIDSVEALEDTLSQDSALLEQINDSLRADSIFMDSLRADSIALEEKKKARTEERKEEEKKRESLDKTMKEVEDLLERELGH